MSRRANILVPRFCATNYKRGRPLVTLSFDREFTSRKTTAMETKQRQAEESFIEHESLLATKTFYATKLAELVLAILSVGLIVDPYSHMRDTDVDTNRAGLAYVAYSGCIVINSVLLLGRLARERLPLRVLLMFTLVDGALLFAAGGVVIEDWRRLRTRMYLFKSKQYMDMMVASGVIAILNGILHFVDIGVTIRYS